MKPIRFLIALLAFSSLYAQPKVRAAGEFVVISDVHFNPLADPSLAPQLMATPPEDWEHLFFNDKDSPGQKYNDDCTWALLNSLVAEVKSLEPMPKLVIVAGDILAHHLQEKFASAGDKDPESYRKFIKNTVAFIALELQRASRGAVIVYTVGNNDDECGDYALQPGGPYLEDTLPAVAAMTHMKPEMLSQWTPLGSYATPNPLAAKHRILVVNTVFWSRRYSNACGSDKDPGRAVMMWLGSELAQARKYREKVWLVYHIPPGIDGHSSSRSGQVTPMWKPQYSEAFNELLDDYRRTIELNLGAHTHLDDFRLVKTEHTNTLVLLTPGVSPNIGQDPAFRLVPVDSHARPLDLTVYYMPHLDTLKWQVEYSSRSAFGLKRIDAESYSGLYQTIDPGSLNSKWWLYYSVSRPESLSTSKGYLRSLYCATGHAEVKGFEACVAAQ